MGNLAFIIALLMNLGIYSFNITTIDGKTISLGTFQGKKILFVNTASNSKYVSQFGKLEQLFQKYKDSLVVIAFPSNDFKNEPLNNIQINSLITATFHPSYILAAKTTVTGNAIAPVYKWLSSFAQNGSIENPVIEDFCKYLVDGKGHVIGVFAGSVDPMDSVIQNAITN